VRLRFLFLAAAIGLAGCAPDNSVFSGYDMTLDSEQCRSDAVTQIGGAKPDAVGMTAGERQAAYDRAYRDCMAVKGYQIAAPN